MATLTFDTKAKALADELQHVATKEDMLLLKKEIAEVKVDLFKWLVPVLFGQAGVIVALVKLL